MDDRTLIAQATSGDHAATQALVTRLLPVVQARVARALVRRARPLRRDARQEMEDIVQEVFMSFFEQDARILRAWEPQRGLSLASFAGLIAEREVFSILRSGRRSPWTEEAAELEMLEQEAEEVEALDIAWASRELLDALIDRLRETLSPLGLEMFERIVVEDEPTSAICRATGMSPDAVYAWRSRLQRLARKLASELSEETGYEPFPESAKVVK